MRGDWLTPAVDETEVEGARLNCGAFKRRGTMSARMMKDESE
jgi:hypothetical protein